MKILTLNQLLSKWHRFSYPIKREEINSLDWDELLLSLLISCPQAEGKDVVISDIDMTTYSMPAVSFSLE